MKLLETEVNELKRQKLDEFVGAVKNCIHEVIEELHFTMKKHESKKIQEVQQLSKQISCCQSDSMACLNQLREQNQESVDDLKHV